MDNILKLNDYKLMIMKQGDIYQTNLKDGRFGAVKVLKTGGAFDFSPSEFYLIGVTTYIDNIPPSIDDARLKEILATEFIYPKGKKLIQIHSGKFPKTCKYIGNITINNEESELKIEIGGSDGFSLCGKIKDDIGYEALIEWRYKYDHEAFSKEIEISRAENEKLMKELRNRNPKKMLSDEQFWNIISKLDWEHQGNDDKVLEPAIRELSKLKVSEIKNFEETLAYKLFQLDTKSHAQNIGEYSYDEKEDYLSVDMFLYARCAVIANGRLTYEEIVKDASKMLKDIDFEALLSLSENAYELKTGKEWTYENGISYETFSNIKGWE